MESRKWTDYIRPITSNGKNAMRFSIVSRGILSFNDTAYRAMQCPGAVRLKFDEDHRVIGIVPVAEGTRGACTVRRRKSASTTQLSVSLQHFCREFKIDVTRNILFYEPAFDPDGNARAQAQRRASGGLSGPHEGF